jgi:hypothetical protein
MYQPLVPCPACDRHVRTTHDHCPFCAAALPTDLARHAIPSAPRRLGRAAAFAFGATVSLTACGGDVVGQGGTTTGTGGEGGSTTTTTTTMLGTLYGGAPPPDDAGGGGTLYGGPIPPFDAGGGGADYGSPPPPVDAGSVDGG